MFRVIFVLDIFNGVVLHASGKLRENYRPVHTISKLCNNSNPLDIVTQIRPREAYVADLNRLCKTGTDNYELIRQLSSHTAVMADTGIETLQDLVRCLEVADTAVIGTETASTEVILEAARRYPGKVNVSIDMKYGSLLSKDAALTDPFDLVSLLNEIDVNNIILLDLDRVGTKRGLNTDLLERLAAYSRHDILAGGGIGNIRDLEALESIGVKGALVATAVHRGDIPVELLR